MTGLDERKGWIQKATIGNGGFGTVILWEHKESNEYIALKQCRLAQDMSEKHRNRWQMEINIMKKLNHKNVIAAMDVPSELDVDKNEIPVLAMEYCSGGDLRRVLNAPENCCGLKEYVIQCLVHDIASAVEYLHKNRIIHRDLKPENIVLKKKDEERTIYKLIDLGYAKELSQESVCTSFVGTLQYLAPELFAGDKYTCTVDYWSFGTVIFECIVGYRPFLPDHPPIKWRDAVMKKAKDDICTFIDADGNVTFSKKLPTPNSLSRSFQFLMEKWLRMMLMWNPELRGQRKDNNERPECFTYLDHILEQKIVSVFIVSTNQLLSYPIGPNQKVKYLQQMIQSETKIPIAEQDLLLHNGVPVNENQPIELCWNKPEFEEDWPVCLFRKDYNYLMAKKIGKPIPEKVQWILKEPNTVMQYADQKRAWAEAVAFCQEQTTNYKRLNKSQKVAMLSMLRTNKDLQNLKKQVLYNTGILTAKIEVFSDSLKYDIEKYEEQAETGVSSEKMFSRWKSRGEEVEKLKVLNETVIELEQKATVIQMKIGELQRSPCALNKPFMDLDEVEQRAMNLYKDLRAVRRCSEYRGDQNKMLAEIVHCLKYKEKCFKDMYIYLNKISDCRADIAKLLPKMEACLKEIANSCDQVKTFQHQLQSDLWTLVRLKVPLHQIDPPCDRTSPQVSPQVTFTHPSFESLPQSSLLDSLKVMEDNRENLQRLTNLISSFTQEEECVSLMAAFTSDDIIFT